MMLDRQIEAYLKHHSPVPATLRLKPFVHQFKGLWCVCLRSPGAKPYMAAWERSFNWPQVTELDWHEAIRKALELAAKC